MLRSKIKPAAAMLAMILTCLTSISLAADEREDLAASKQTEAKMKMKMDKAETPTATPASDPASLLKAADELGLGKEQIERLKEIQAETDAASKNLLTAAQRKKLAVLSAKPPMAKMCAMCMAEMAKKEKAAKTAKEECACMKEMKAKKSEAGDKAKDKDNDEKGEHKEHKH